MKKLFAVLVGSCALVLGVAAPAFAVVPHPFLENAAAEKIPAFVGALVHGLRGL